MEQPERLSGKSRYRHPYTGTGTEAADTEKPPNGDVSIGSMRRVSGQVKLRADGCTEQPHRFIHDCPEISPPVPYGYYPYAVYGNETLAEGPHQGHESTPGEEPVLSERQRPGLVSDPAEPLQPRAGKTSRPICQGRPCRLSPGRGHCK